MRLRTPDGGEAGPPHSHFGFSYCRFASPFIVVVSTRRRHRSPPWFSRCAGTSHTVSKCGENTLPSHVVGGALSSLTHSGFAPGFECLRYGEVLIVCHGFPRWVSVMGVMVEGAKSCFLSKTCVNCSPVENVSCGSCFLGPRWVMNVLVDSSWCRFDCLSPWISIVWITWFGFGWELVECIRHPVCVCRL